jgi:hypothetical protein
VSHLINQCGKENVCLGGGGQKTMKTDPRSDQGVKGTSEYDCHQSPPVAAGCFVGQPVESLAHIDPEQGSECACMCV